MGGIKFPCVSLHLVPSSGVMDVIQSVAEGLDLRSKYCHLSSPDPV